MQVIINQRCLAKIPKVPSAQDRAEIRVEAPRFTPHVKMAFVPGEKEHEEASAVATATAATAAEQAEMATEDKDEQQESEEEDEDDDVVESGQMGESTAKKMAATAQDWTEEAWAMLQETWAKEDEKLQAKNVEEDNMQMDALDTEQETVQDRRGNRKFSRANPNVLRQAACESKAAMENIVVIDAEVSDLPVPLDRAATRAEHLGAEETQVLDSESDDDSDEDEDEARSSDEEAAGTEQAGEAEEAEEAEEGEEEDEVVDEEQTDVDVHNPPPLQNRQTSADVRVVDISDRPCKRRRHSAENVSFSDDRSCSVQLISMVIVLLVLVLRFGGLGFRVYAIWFRGGCRFRV